jgi:hypothetical protein
VIFSYAPFRKQRRQLPMKEAGVEIPSEQQTQFIEEERAYYRSIVYIDQYSRHSQKSIN